MEKKSATTDEHICHSHLFLLAFGFKKLIGLTSVVKLGPSGRQEMGPNERSIGMPMHYPANNSVTTEKRIKQALDAPAMVDLSFTSSISFSKACLLREPTNNLCSTAPTTSQN
jgi:hypothetical protein